MATTSYLKAVAWLRSYSSLEWPNGLVVSISVVIIVLDFLSPVLFFTGVQVNDRFYCRI